MDISTSDAGAFWLKFLCKLKRRGRADVKLMIPDIHEAPKPQ